MGEVVSFVPRPAKEAPKAFGALPPLFCPEFQSIFRELSEQSIIAKILALPQFPYRIPLKSLSIVQSLSDLTPLFPLVTFASRTDLPRE